MATGLARSHAWQSPCLRSTQAPMFPVPGLASSLARPWSPVPRHTGRLLRRPPAACSSQRQLKKGRAVATSVCNGLATTCVGWRRDSCATKGVGSGALPRLGLFPSALSGSLEGGVPVDTDEAAPVLAHLLPVLAQLLLATFLSGPFVFHVRSTVRLTVSQGATRGTSRNPPSSAFSKGVVLLPLRRRGIEGDSTVLGQASSLASTPAPFSAQVSRL